MNNALRMTTTLQRMILVVALGSMLTACAATEGYPDRTLNVDDDLKALKLVIKAFKISDYDEATDLKKRGMRNDYVFDRMTAIDLQFGKFQKAIFKDGVQMGIGTDWVVLGLGGAGALVSGGTSQILSAISGGVIGAKGAFDKQAYFNNTITTLLGAMVANRKTVEVKIRQGLAQLDADYPLSAALVHLTEYYEAGTIPGALTGIAADTGVKAQKADVALANLVVGGPVPAQVQTLREAAASYVWDLDEQKEVGKLRILANALGVPKDNDARDGILDKITLARTLGAMEAIGQAIAVIKASN